MGVLNKKLRRDIFSEKGRFIAVTFLVFLGIALFASTWQSYLNLDRSYKNTSTELKYADFMISTGPAPDSVVGDLAQISGVSEVLGRSSLESGVTLPEDKNIVGRLIGVPASEKPPVNDLLIEKGSYLEPGDTGSCLVEVHIAEYYGLEPGDTVSVQTPVGTEELSVAGVAASPEFLYVTKEGGELFVSPRNYGVVFVPQEWIQSSFGMEGISNEFSFLVEKGEDPEAVMKKAEEQLSAYGIIYARLGDEQPARQALDLDVQGFKEMSEFFPVLFLAVAALSLFMILTRMIHTQQGLVGIMSALGIKRRKITAHYVSYSLIVGFTGSVAGVIVGYLLAGWMTEMYAAELSIPLVCKSFDIVSSIIAVAASLAVCVLASIMPVRKLFKIQPAGLLRGDISEKGDFLNRIPFLERILPFMRKLPPLWKLPLRNLSKKKRRTVFNIAGIAFALTLIIVSLSLVDSMVSLLSFQFDDVVNYDARVYFNGPVGEEELGALNGLSGTTEVEPIVVSPCRILEDGKVLTESIVTVLPENSPLLVLYDLSGEKIKAPQKGVALGSWFKVGLDVEDGQEVVLETIQGSAPVQVSGFIKEVTGASAYMSFKEFESLTGEKGVFNVALVNSDESDGEKLRNDLMGVEGVAGVEITEYTREMLKSQFMGLMFMFAGMMIAFSVAMALALIYNTMSISFIEREREIGLMGALGHHRSELLYSMTLENMIVVLASIIPGMILGYLFSSYMMEIFSSEAFNGTAVIFGRSWAISIAGILLVALISEIPSYFRLRRIDLAKMVKERSL